MTIICHVAADFVNSDGDVFRIGGKDINLIKEAPEWIKDTLMFKWLANDGSIKFVTKDNAIKAENDPVAGVDAEGKGIRSEVDEEKEEEQPKKRTTRKKKDDAE